MMLQKVNGDTAVNGAELNVDDFDSAVPPLMSLVCDYMNTPAMQAVVGAGPMFDR
jgi:hypothetical protein